MLGWFQSLMPKEERFFKLFEKHAAIVVAGAEALRGLLQGGGTIEGGRGQVKAALGRGFSIPGHG